MIQCTSNHFCVFISDRDTVKVVFLLVFFWYFMRGCFEDNFCVLFSKTSTLFDRPPPFDISFHGPVTDGRPTVRVHWHGAERSPPTGGNEGIQDQKEEEGQTKRAHFLRRHGFLELNKEDQDQDTVEQQ